MPKIEMYTKSWCPYCQLAKNRLESRHLEFEEIPVPAGSPQEADMFRRSGRTSVPQIFVSGQHVGGSDDLQRADETGLLDALLSKPFAGESP